MNALFLAPFLLHFVLVCGLYAWLTFERARAVMGGGASYADFKTPRGDPPAAARVRRNLANQFEAPLFAYFAALFLIFSGAVGGFDIAVAWLFLAGRAVHTLIQTLTDNVRLRGLAFMVNFIAIVLLMAHVALVGLTS